MAERGGPTNQDGVYYQNSVAAQYLAELLSLHSAQPRETVVEVRMEAPTHVDDIVVRYADGHREWIQAKANLHPHGPPWTGLWESFSLQAKDPTFARGDRLVIAMGKRNDLSEQLQTIIERASTSADDGELLGRLGADTRKLYQAIQKALPDDVPAFDLLRLVDLRIQTEAEIGGWFDRLDLGSANAVPRSLLSNLRDLAGGTARVRGTFRAAPLRARLAQNFGADLFEPREWGLAAYRGTVIRSARIDIPGRGISAPVQDIIVWPRVRRRDNAVQQDFDDETPSWEPRQQLSDVQLSRFPETDLFRCILIAGPGMGKSALVTALVRKLADTPIVPVEVPLSAIVSNDQGVVEFLAGSVNRYFSVRVDWQRLADQGLLCVFFDGLDEVSSAHRTVLLKKLNLFSARFPDVPWLLTVRDPAALNGPLDGELLELELFDNPEIADLVDKYKVWSPGLEHWTFIQNLQAYPDLGRLARIPLFLSIMLAGWSPGAALPRKRSDILDTYLAILFDPDRSKAHSAPSLSATELRSIAQALAFSSLEREEIGLSRRQAEQVMPLHTDAPVDTALSQLVARGVLRTGSDGRLRFPYPIVQEYLAAVHLVHVLPDQIAHRIGDVVKRPWAQVLQFALELLPDPTAHIKKMLSAPDDVFSTGLRLIGRCIANGAAVAPDLRSEIGSQLAQLWGETDYILRERVGRLIVDAYSNPLHPEVRKRLGWRWLLGSGVGEIVTRAANRDLTLSVVDQLFAGKTGMFLNLHDLEGALQSIAPQLVKRVAERSHSREATDEQFDGLIEFLDRISVVGNDAQCLIELAEDEGLPLKLRVAARGAIGDPPDESSLKIACDAAADEDWKVQRNSPRVFSRCVDPVKDLGRMLTDPTIPSRAKDYLVEHLDFVVRDAAARGDAAVRLLELSALDKWHANILRVYALRAGQRSLMVEMVERLDVLSSEVAQEVLVSLNCHPERAIGIRALEQVQRRRDPPSDIPGTSIAALTGLTYKVSDHGWRSYSLEEVPPHPSTEAWWPMFDRWLNTSGLTKVQRLRMLNRLVKHRQELISEIKDIVFSATNPDAPEWDEDDYGHDLRSGLDELRRMRVDVPFDIAETFALAKRPNLIYAGVNVFSAKATREALDRLLALYKIVDADNRAFVLNAIEIVASRLNVTITEETLSSGSTQK